MRESKQFAQKGGEDIVTDVTQRFVQVLPSHLCKVGVRQFNPRFLEKLRQMYQFGLDFTHPSLCNAKVYSN